MEKITVRNAFENQSFNLQLGGKNLKSIQQKVSNAVVNGIKTASTIVEVASVVEQITIILPIKGFWKFAEDKSYLQFFSREGECAEFKILFI